MEGEHQERISFEGPREEALRQQADAGWANESAGGPGTATGPIWRISNSAEELDDLKRTFGEQWRELGVQPAEMIGHFIIGESTAEGDGVVIEFQSEDALVAAFNALKKVSRKSNRGEGG